MGMDVYGKKPTDPKGEYFRNNVWWWHPLADYIETNHPSIAARCADWHSNSGYGLDADDATALAAGLRDAISDGRAAAWQARRDAALAALPRLQCDLCDGTGVRRDEVGVKMGQPDKVIEDPKHPRHGQRGWCNGCDGHGTVADFRTNYVFDVDNLAEFAEFLEHCGGFEIN